MKENYFLAKWLNKEVTEEELKKNISEEEIRSYKKIIAASNNLTKHGYNVEENLAKIKALHSKSKIKKLHFPKILYRVAAVITILFATYYFISDKNTSYSTNLAEKITFELPDNSIVNLNAGSKIVYKAKNWGNKRELNLKGEAFFSVEKGSKFTVNTSLASVTVLGTKFNVVERGAYFEVNCYEGLVSATYQNETVKIPAGSSFIVLNGVTKFHKTTLESNPAWLQNNSVFKSMPYSYVINELERQYNIKITYDKAFENSLFTGNFTHEDLEIALKAISIPFNLKYTIISDKKVSLYK